MANDEPLNRQQLSRGEALAIVSQFFVEEWPGTREDDVEVTKVTNGYSSTVHVIKRRSPVVKEPACLLIRQLNSYFLDREETSRLTETEQALLFHELSRRVWGPHLYGVKEGCRVEQFIPSHTLKTEEWADQRVLNSLALAYARIHTLSLPIRKAKMDVCMEDLLITFPRFLENQESIRHQILSANYVDSEYLAKHLFTLDFLTEIQWIRGLLKEKQCKPALVHTDVNFLNILVREDGQGDSLIVPIDYEHCMIAQRGNDVGGLFVNRMLCWNGKDSKRSSHPYPSLSERRAFCRAYLKALQHLHVPQTDTDTEDHLLMEAEIGTLLYAVFLMFVVIKHLDYMIQEPSFLSALRIMFDVFRQRKAALLEIL